VESKECWRQCICGHDEQKKLQRWRAVYVSMKVGRMLNAGIGGAALYDHNERKYGLKR
jgi:hypothetical protein